MGREIKKFLLTNRTDSRRAGSGTMNVHWSSHCRLITGRIICVCGSKVNRFFWVALVFFDINQSLLVLFAVLFNINLLSCRHAGMLAGDDGQAAGEWGGPTPRPI